MFRPWIAFSILFLAVAPYSRVHAQDAARRERARELTVQADQRARLGDVAAADRLYREAARTLQSSRPRREARPEIRQLEERLGDLTARLSRLDDDRAPEPERDQVRREIEVTERLLIRIRKAAHADELPAGPAEAEFDIASAKIEDAHRRIEHLRVAAENLRAAGIPRLADELIQKAEAWDRQLEESRRRVEAERAARHGDPRDTEIHELQEQNERLRDEVRALREELERR